MLRRYEIIYLNILPSTDDFYYICYYYKSKTKSKSKYV